MWTIEVRCDVVRRAGFVESLHAWVYYEYYFVIARRDDKAYIHFVTFREWDGADRLARRIRESTDFTPEGKPHLWTRAYDLKPIRPWRRDWRRKLVYGR